MSAIRLAAIGAGSAEFSPGVIKDLCTRSALAGSGVTLMDVDELRLAVTHRRASAHRPRGKKESEGSGQSARRQRRPAMSAGPRGAIAPGAGIAVTAIRAT